MCITATENLLIYLLYWYTSTNTDDRYHSCRHWDVLRGGRTLRKHQSIRYFYLLEWEQKLRAYLVQTFTATDIPKCVAEVDRICTLVLLN
jgi:hypothetical protein